MFGTELDTAYFNSKPTNLNYNDNLPHIIKSEESEPINEPQNTNNKSLLSLFFNKTIML